MSSLKCVNFVAIQKSRTKCKLCSHPKKAGLILTCPSFGYSFILRSPNQTVNQIRRSYKNDQSNIFVTVSISSFSLSFSKFHAFYSFSCLACFNAWPISCTILVLRIVLQSHECFVLAAPER